MKTHLMQKVHRVVVTGMGAVTPLGLNAKSSFNALRNGEMGIRRIPNPEEYKC